MSVIKKEKPGYHYAKVSDASSTVKKSTAGERALTGICIALCVILIPILAVILTLEIKSLVYPENPASIFGYLPLVVESDEMKLAGGEIVFESNDLLLLREVKQSDIRNDDIVLNENGNRPACNSDGTFMLKVGASKLDGNDIVLDYGDIVACVSRDDNGDVVYDSNNHRTYTIRKIYEFAYNQNGDLLFHTGDLNGNLYKEYVAASDIVGIYNTKRPQNSGWTIETEQYMYDGAKVSQAAAVFTWLGSKIGISVVAAASLLIIALIIVFSCKSKSAKKVN